MNENTEHAGRPWQIPPLIARELLGYSRQPWTYWLRLLSALGAVSVLGIMATSGRNRLGQADGRALFTGSTAILFFVASFNGLRSTSDCIGSERRQGTLVLLFLADLKFDTILVSKLVTNSLRNAWALLGTLPVLGLCLLLGGVSGWVFVQGVLAILAAAWLSLMVGLEQSCRNQGEHEAFSHGLRRLLLLNLLPLVSPASLVLFAAAGIISVCALLCVNRSLKLAPASVVVPYQYSMIVWAVMFGIVVFGDVPSAATIVGAAIIIGAGLYIFLRERSLGRGETVVNPPA